MSTITTILGTQRVKDTRATINTNFANLNADKIENLAGLGLTQPAANYNNAALSVFPAGGMIAWGTLTAPSTWLLCNGQAVSRTTYAVLFAVIGTTYGVGDGSTTFNVPNIQGRVLVGRDAGQTEFDTLGETGGAKTHTLTVPEIPAHTHTLPTDAGGGSINTLFGGNAVSYGTDLTASTGGGLAHNNLQPYIVLNYIIKT